MIEMIEESEIWNWFFQLPNKNNIICFTKEKYDYTLKETGVIT